MCRTFLFCVHKNLSSDCYYEKLVLIWSLTWKKVRFSNQNYWKNVGLSGENLEICFSNLAVILFKYKTGLQVWENQCILPLK